MHELNATTTCCPERQWNPSNVNLKRFWAFSQSARCFFQSKESVILISILDWTMWSLPFTKVLRTSTLKHSILKHSHVMSWEEFYFLGMNYHLVPIFCLNEKKPYILYTKLCVHCTSSDIYRGYSAHVHISKKKSALRQMRSSFWLWWPLIPYTSLH